jgi:hypothetical protein
LRRNPFIVNATIKLQFHYRQVAAIAFFPQITPIKNAQIIADLLAAVVGR